MVGNEMSMAPVSWRSRPQFSPGPTSKPPGGSMTLLALFVG